MRRREFLAMTAALPWCTAMATGAGQAAGERTDSQQRIVVLVKLAGGNDGLNTLIPYTDPHYYKARPTLAVPKHHLIDLGQGMAMNPYLRTLKPWWDKGQLAWVQGVGYPEADLSHFHSLDVWETANKTDDHAVGWLGGLLPSYKEGLHAIVIGDRVGPFASKNCNCIAMHSPQVFINQINVLESIPQVVSSNPVLAHLGNVYHQLHAAGKQLADKLQRPLPRLPGFATSSIGRDLESVAKMILAGVDAPVYLVTLDGFDTHSNQAAVQSNLLHQLAGALMSFAQAMEQGGRWDDVLVLTYSEFGRRVQENHGRGTDHGTASVQLAMGGKVRGGIYGDKPDLAQLDPLGNLYHTVDFRSVYGSVVQRWLGMANPWEKLGTVPFV